MSFNWISGLDAIDPQKALEMTDEKQSVLIIEMVINSTKLIKSSGLIALTCINIICYFDYVEEFTYIPNLTSKYRSPVLSIFQ